MSVTGDDLIFDGAGRGRRITVRTSLPQIKSIRTETATTERPTHPARRLPSTWTCTWTWTMAGIQLRSLKAVRGRSPPARALAPVACTCVNAEKTRTTLMLTLRLMTCGLSPVVTPPTPRVPPPTLFRFMYATRHYSSACIVVCSDCCFAPVASIESPPVRNTGVSHRWRHRFQNNHNPLTLYCAIFLFQFLYCFLVV